MTKFIFSFLALGFMLFFLGVHSSLSAQHPLPRIYEDGGYQGASINLTCSEENLHRYGWGDLISSSVVPQGWTLVFYEHTGYRGATFTVNEGRIYHYRDFGWNDTPSSVLVYHHGVQQDDCRWR